MIGNRNTVENSQFATSREEQTQSRPIFRTEYMKMWPGKLIGLSLCITVWSQAYATYVEIVRIEIEGHHKTREYTIRRELDFSEGDTITLTNLTTRFERNRANLLNTALFTEVSIGLENKDSDIHRGTVTIRVKEAWYLYVLPIIELADRNFNVWWQEHNRAFNRLNLGIRAEHINFSGHADRLRIKGQLGYTPKFEFTYSRPYFNRGRSLGLSAGVIWSINKEIGYRSEGNKLHFHRDDHSIIYRRLQLQAGLRFRPNLYLTYEVEFGYQIHTIAEIIAKELNPDYFLEGRTRQRNPYLRFKGSFDERDLNLFPTQGVLCGVEITKNGLGFSSDVNALYAEVFGEYHHLIRPGMSIGLAVKGQTGLLRHSQPFHNYQAIGYGTDYLRGYELYVINGLDFAIVKQTTKIRLHQTSVDWRRKMPAAFREMHIQFFLTVNFDTGYVNDPFYADGNPLTNRILYGGGPGLTVLLYNTFALSAEYSFNDLGERGLFLHTKTSF